jgi:hypothetical protein
MNIVIIIIVAILLLCLSLAPALLIWSLTALLSKKSYSLPYLKMTGLCFLLSLVTAVIINLELEAGVISVLLFITVFSFLWSLILLPFVYIFKIRGSTSSFDEVEENEISL